MFPVENKQSGIELWENQRTMNCGQTKQFGLISTFGTPNIVFNNLRYDLQPSFTKVTYSVVS